MSEANESAFAAVAVGPSGDICYSPGLTKREYFAGLAMQNLQNVMLRKSGHELLQATMFAHSTNSIHVAIAAEAICFANALLAELAKGQKE